MVTKEQVMKALESVFDPEFPISVVDMGLIYDVKVSKASVSVSMTLTNPGCPMSSVIVNMVKNKIEGLKGVKAAEIELTFDPPWTPEMLSSTAKKKLGL